CRRHVLVAGPGLARRGRSAPEQRRGDNKRLSSLVFLLPWTPTSRRDSRSRRCLSCNQRGAQGSPLCDSLLVDKQLLRCSGCTQCTPRWSCRHGAETTTEECPRH